MNKTNYFIECLELMDWTVKPSGLCPGEWLVYKIDSHEHLTAQQIEDKARKELIKRDGVMERVVAFTQDNQEWESVTHNKETGHYWSWTDDAEGDPTIGRPYTPVELLELAIELGITPKELMGVEV